MYNPEATVFVSVEDTFYNGELVSIIPSSEIDNRLYLSNEADAPYQIKWAEECEIKVKKEFEKKKKAKKKEKKKAEKKKEKKYGKSK
jgi:hypothetical protein